MSEAVLPEGVAMLAEIGLMSQALVHELRQPLFAAIAAVELELASSSTGSVRLSSALTQLRHLQEVVERHQGLLREDEPAMRLPLLAPVDAAVATLRHRAGLTGASIRLVVQGEGPWVEAPQAAIRQVMINLIANALDAVEGTGTRHVEVVVRRCGDRAVVEVDDTGPGIDPAVRDRLFDRFVTTKAIGRGTGLGLHVSLGLARAMGGTVRLDDRAEGGARARLDLPRVDPPGSRG